AARIAQEGAHLSEVCHAGEPEAILGYVGKIVCGELFECGPRLPLAAEFTIDQRQSWAPGRRCPMLLHKMPDDRCELLQTPLLSAQGEHLHAKGSVYTLGLEPLPNGQGLLGELLTLHKT